VKKVFLAIMMLLFLAGPCFAAGSSFTVTSDVLVRNYGAGKLNFRVLTLAFTADDTDGSIPNLTLNPSGWTDGTNTGTFGVMLTGFYAYKIEIDCNHAGTEPTENSEIYIYQNGFDLLAAGGVDQIDNSVERQVFFSNGTSPQKQPIVGALTVTVTQQAVVTNSATGTIYLILTVDY